LKAELEAKGIPLNDLDLQIASIALEPNTTLITKNNKYFSLVEGLLLANWLQQVIPEK